MPPIWGHFVVCEFQAATPGRCNNDHWPPLLVRAFAPKIFSAENRAPQKRAMRASEVRGNPSEKEKLTLKCAWSWWVGFESVHNLPDYVFLSMLDFIFPHPSALDRISESAEFVTNTSDICARRTIDFDFGDLEFLWSVF